MIACCNHPWDILAINNYLTRYIYQNNINLIRADLIRSYGGYYVFDSININDFLENLNNLYNSIPEDYWDGFEIKTESEDDPYWW